jgi:hypothetical protein
MAICFGKTPPKTRDPSVVAEQRESDSTSSEESLSETVRDLPSHGFVEKMTSSMTDARPTGLRRVSNKCNLL